MIHLYIDTTKEKVELQEAVIVSDITTTIASIPAGTSWANYINKTDYEIDGYKLIGFVGQVGGNGVILCDWNIASSDQKLMLSFVNPMSTDRTNVTINVKGLYVKVA